MIEQGQFDAAKFREEFNKWIRDNDPCVGCSDYSVCCAETSCFEKALADFLKWLIPKENVGGNQD
jgi:hypothetical protein